MSAARDVGLLLAFELNALASRLESGDWLCCCGPAYVVDGVLWSYQQDPAVGWHDPSIDHPALWPTGVGV